MKKLSFHRSIFAWFFLAFLILTLVSLSSYKSFKELDTEKDWVDHTYAVMQTVDDIFADMKDVQSAQRGYAIAGQGDFLTPYTLALPDITEKIAKLKILVQDNPEQVERFNRLADQIDARLKIAKEGIDAYDQKGQEAAFDLIKQGIGKKEMGIIRTLVLEMLSEETHLLQLRQYTVKQTTSTTLAIGGAGVFITLTILILVFWTIHRESTKREKIEDSLQLAINNMEHATHQTAMIGRLSDYLQSSQSIDEAFRVIDNSLPQLLEGTSGMVAIFKKSREMIETMSHWGIEGQNNLKDFHPEKCWGLRRGRAHYYVPGGTEPCCAHFISEPAGASLCLPMQAQGETLGLFSVLIDDIAKTSKERVAFARRVSEQISLAIANLNLQNKLLEQSIRDPLTRLFNRRYLETTLERELTRAERHKEHIGILVLDIDHFKRFNDTMGHDAGDALLSQFAALLENNVRKEDIVCRYGGEEFVIVLPKANLEMAIERAKKICEATRKLKIKSLADNIRSVSVSIGVSAFPDHGGTGPDLITIADEALYKAKQNGRDQVMSAVPKEHA